MPQVIDVKVGSEKGEFSLAMIQNYIQQQNQFELVYYVIADNTSQDAVTISNATGIPALGTRLYSMFCDSVKPEEDSQIIHFATGVMTKLWCVTVHFTTQLRDISDNTPNTNWGGEVENEHFEFDLITGAQITTTAGEPIFMERPVLYQTLKIHRLENYPWDYTIPARFVNRVNLNPFYGVYPRGTCLLMPVEIEEDTQNNVRVIWATYTIKIKIAFNTDGSLMQDTWRARPLNQGYYYRPTPRSKAVVKRDKNGQPIKVNLDWNGTELLDHQGVLLNLVGPWTTTVPSLNPLEGVYDITYPPNVNHIGSWIVIDPSSGVGWNAGTYQIVDIATVASKLCWILNDDPGSSTAVGTGILTNGVYTLVRNPIYLEFNRAYYADLNLLTLGPF